MSEEGKGNLQEFYAKMLIYTFGGDEKLMKMAQKRVPRVIKGLLFYILLFC
jgi:hypothetical protein